MNEFITDGVSGILVYSQNPAVYEDYQLVGDVVRPVKPLSPDDICNTVERVLATPMELRRKMGVEARKRYEEDTKYMVQRIREVFPSTI
jgi:hypothetical protein